jgi:hypothetical protein
VARALLDALSAIDSKAIATSGIEVALFAVTADMHLNKAMVQSGGKTPLHLAAAKVPFFFNSSGDI